jgi:uncharacterized damage-inducible protein DinB
MKKRDQPDAKPNTNVLLGKTHTKNLSSGLLSPQTQSYRQVSEQSNINHVSAAFVNHARGLLVGEYLPKLEMCLESLTDEQVWWRANDESNSIGNLMLHLAGNARQWIVAGLGGRTDERNRSWEFAQREGISREELLKRLRDVVYEVDSVLNTLDLSKLLDYRLIQAKEVTALAAVFHVTEHFSMHTGQIILLTKLLTAKDLRFYGFEHGKPVYRWRSASSND